MNSILPKSKPKRKQPKVILFSILRIDRHSRVRFIIKRAYSSGKLLITLNRVRYVVSSGSWALQHAIHRYYQKQGFTRLKDLENVECTILQDGNILRYNFWKRNEPKSGIESYHPNSQAAHDAARQSAARP